MTDMTQWIGKTHSESCPVTKDMLASSLKSGSVNVLATPYMIAMMEYACMQLIQPGLEKGITTVGTLVNVTHTAPTVAGMTITTEAELTETDGRRFVFRVTARDERGVIGEGVHERHSIKAAGFEKKAGERAGISPENH